MKKFLWIPLLALIFTSCEKGTIDRQLIFKFKFDPTMVRLDDSGIVSPVNLPFPNPQLFAAQDARINFAAANYLELLPNDTTKFMDGLVLYKAPFKQMGLDSGIDISSLKQVAPGEVFYSMSLKDVKPGTYEWMRVGVAYQNFDVNFRVDNYNGINFSGIQNGTVMSFLGYNNYIENLTTKLQPQVINSFKRQGFSSFEANFAPGGVTMYPYIYNQFPVDSNTTIVNHLHNKVPMNKKFGIMTAAIVPGKLNITGSETQNIVIEINLSTNKSFVWKDLNGNKVWDAISGEPVVDCGFRGMIPKVLF
jgi:hypothetical protein